jgi:hypothetical protein
MRDIVDREKRRLATPIIHTSTHHRYRTNRAITQEKAPAARTSA